MAVISMWTVVTGVLSFAGGLVGLMVLVYSLYLIYIHHKYSHIPGPPRSRHLDHGRTICIFMFHRPLVCTAEPELIKEITVTGNHPISLTFYKQVKCLYGQRFLGDGLECVFDQNIWTKRRAQLNPAFKRQSLLALLDEFNDAANDLMDKLRGLADGKTVIRLADELNKIALDVIGKVAFNHNINSIHDDKSPLPSAVTMSLFGLNECLFGSPLSQFLPINLEVKRKTREAIRYMRKTAHEWMSERREALIKGESVPEDLLSLLVQTTGASESEQIEMSLDDFVTFFIAGQESSANAAAFTLMELGRHPDILNKVQEELEEVLGQKYSVSKDDLGHLVYLDQVFKESLRMHPPAPMITRCLKYDVSQGACVIPEGSDITISIYAAARMPEFYPEPEKFDPDRWGPGKSNPPYTFLPFSTGPKTCIGQNFARMEAKIILARFLQLFKMELDPTQSFSQYQNSTLRPCDGVRARLTLRT